MGKAVVVVCTFLGIRVAQRSQRKNDLEVSK